MLDEEQEAELRNPFPAPPSHYTNYTDHNLALLALLKSRTDELQVGSSSDSRNFGVEEDAETALARQRKLLADQKDVPEWSLLQLEPPRVDWIVEDGEYNVYGDTWRINDAIPSLGQLGGHQLYPEDPSVDRRPALQSILRTLLKSYLDFIRTLLVAPPPPTETEPPEWQAHAEWLTVMSQNIMSAANELRPVQARVNLEVMMKRQLQLRREETAAVHQTCDALEKRLNELKAMAAPLVSAQYSSEPPKKPLSSQPSAKQDVTYASVNMEDVLLWAEGGK